MDIPTDPKYLQPMTIFRFRFTHGRTGAVHQGEVTARDEREARRIIMDGRDGRSWKGWIVRK